MSSVPPIESDLLEEISVPALAPLPPDVHQVLVHALAIALVREYRRGS